MILLAVVNGQPREMGLIQAIKYFIDHRVDVVRRRTAYLLQKAHDREHILEGYLTALDHLDNVITIIRGSANRADARENLVAYFGGKKIDINTTGRAPKLDAEKPFTTQPGRRHPRTAIASPDQALDRRNLQRIERRRDNIAEYESILGSEKKLRNVIIKELEEVKKLYGDERRTAHRRRSRGNRSRRSHRRRASRRHRQPLRLHEAHADLHLPHAAPRRHGPHRHEDARRRFRRASLHRLHPRLHSDFHQQRPRLLAQGVRNSRRQRRRQRQAHRQPGRPAARRNRAHHARRARSGRRKSNTSSSPRATAW